MCGPLSECDAQRGSLVVARNIVQVKGGPSNQWSQIATRLHAHISIVEEYRRAQKLRCRQGAIPFFVDPHCPMPSDTRSSTFRLDA